MNVLIFCAVIWAICKLLSAASRGAKERAAERERERIRQEQTRIREEQAAQREEMRLMRERAKAETRRQIEQEKARIAWQKRQDAINRQAQAERERLRKEQERQAKEQARQAAQLEKHEQELTALRFKVDQIDEDLPLLHSQLDYQLAQMDALQDALHKAQLAVRFDETAIRTAGTHSAVKGKDYDAHKAAVEKAEGKIIKLQNAIRATEKKIAKAQFDREQAQRKLA